ncbi:MAG: hypothetical protein GY765_35720 [bacterium]|nr:hypothetical protein [bacterium]
MMIIKTVKLTWIITFVCLITCCSRVPVIKLSQETVSSEQLVKRIDNEMPGLEGNGRLLHRKERRHCYLNQ